MCEGDVQYILFVFYLLRNNERNRIATVDALCRFLALSSVCAFVWSIERTKRAPK